MCLGILSSQYRSVSIFHYCEDLQHIAMKSSIIPRIAKFIIYSTFAAKTRCRIQYRFAIYSSTSCLTYEDLINPPSRHFTFRRNPNRNITMDDRRADYADHEQLERYSWFRFRSHDSRMTHSSSEKYGSPVFTQKKRKRYLWLILENMYMHCIFQENISWM